MKKRKKINFKTGLTMAFKFIVTVVQMSAVLKAIGK